MLLCHVCTPTFPAASLGPLNWERWGYGCILGVVLFGGYGIVEYFYNRKYGPPLPGLNHDDSAESEWPKDGALGLHGGSKDLEIGGMGAGSGGEGSAPQGPEFKVSCKPSMCRTGCCIEVRKWGIVIGNAWVGFGSGGWVYLQQQH